MGLEDFPSLLLKLNMHTSIINTLLFFKDATRYEIILLFHHNYVHFHFITSLFFPPLLLLLTAITTAAQPYKATDLFLLDCGSSTTTTYDDRLWDGDEGSKFTSENITTATSFSSEPSFRDSTVPQTPYSTARIFNGTSSFTYKFPVSQGPKFLRLHFYPATYSDHNTSQAFFSVLSNGYTLLTNFNAFLTASDLGKARSDAGLGGPQIPHFVKEFMIYVKDAQILNVTFKPEPNSYGFINGIEIVSLPENLYFHAKNLNYVGENTGPEIVDDIVLETMYRLNVGGELILSNNDTGMYRSWEPDDEYIFGGAMGWNPVNMTPITYTMETPNYTAPEQVYMTQRSMGNQSDLYNLTWIFPVDSGFYYLIRLHFCNIIPQYNQSGDMVFTIFINNQTAEEWADPLDWTQGNSHPVFKDYVLFVRDASDNPESKQDLWVAMHPNKRASEVYLDGYLNGLEAFKLSRAGNWPELGLSPVSVMSPRKGNSKKFPVMAIVGCVGGGLALLSILVFLVLRRHRQVKNYSTTEHESSWEPTSSELKSSKHLHSSMLSDCCRRFTLKEVKVSTSEFNDNCIIGRGGFGKVYKGYIDNGKATVAIKRLNPSSNQGFHEFQTEIKMLSKLRHVHLVSLIGFCDEDGEMVLVYDYMAHGTLQEHLYKTKNPPLPWKTRLHICIGAAQGLVYLHTSAKRGVIHRDVKSTNILLDENWVAKVADFGLSKLGPKGEFDTHVTTLVKGSVGYLDPEYYRRQQLTDKSDVYSFGVVLFEVLCARPVIIPWLPNEQVNLAEWGNYCYRNGTLDEIVDPKLRGEIAPGSLRKFGEVASSCLKERGSERPAMDGVVCGLEFALMLQEAAEKKDDEEHSKMEGQR